jgi:hypothetical protein
MNFQPSLTELVFLSRHILSWTVKDADGCCCGPFPSWVSSLTCKTKHLNITDMNLAIFLLATGLAYKIKEPTAHGAVPYMFVLMFTVRNLRLKDFEVFSCAEHWNRQFTALAEVR